MSEKAKWFVALLLWWLVLGLTVCSTRVFAETNYYVTDQWGDAAVASTGAAESWWNSRHIANSPGVTMFDLSACNTPWPPTTGAYDPASGDGSDNSLWWRQGASGSYGSCTGANAKYIRKKVCPSGQVYKVPGYSCGSLTQADICAALSGTALGSDLTWYGTNPIGLNVCVNNCRLNVTAASGGSQFRNKGYYTGGYTGATCSSTDTANTPSSSPVACATGKCPGTVNGVEVCVPCTGVAGATATQSCVTSTGAPCSSDNPPNNSTNTQVEQTATTSGDGKTVTTTTTTTTTTIDGSGNKSTAVETTSTVKAVADGDNPIKDFCTKNPTATMCRPSDESSWGGSCGTFTCTGDAVQCAIAQELHTRNCTLFETTTSLSDLGNEAVAGSDSGTSDNPALVGNRDVVNVAPGGVLDQTRWLGGSCPAGVDTVLWGQPVVFTFDGACDVLQIVGSIMVGIALLVGMRIIGGAL